MDRGSWDISEKSSVRKKPATPSSERAIKHLVNTFAERLGLEFPFSLWDKGQG